MLLVLDLPAVVFFFSDSLVFRDLLPTIKYSNFRDTIFRHRKRRRLRPQKQSRQSFFTSNNSHKNENFLPIMTIKLNFPDKLKSNGIKLNVALKKKINIKNFLLKNRFIFRD